MPFGIDIGTTRQSKADRVSIPGGRADSQGHMDLEGVSPDGAKKG
jgi:hypothetical protein